MMLPSPCLVARSADRSLDGISRRVRGLWDRCLPVSTPRRADLIVELSDLEVRVERITIWMKAEPDDVEGLALELSACRDRLAFLEAQWDRHAGVVAA